MVLWERSTAIIFSQGDFGRLLSSWRSVVGKSQAQIAEELGISQPIISSAETGSVMEAQNRIARIFYAQLESFEAGELRELGDCVKLAKSLGETRKWLRLTREIVASQAAVGVGAVQAAESPTFVAGIVQYVSHVIEAMASLDDEQRRLIIHKTFMPWFWAIPLDSSIAKGARRPERFPEAGTKEFADRMRKMRDADFDGRD